MKDGRAETVATLARKYEEDLFFVSTSALIVDGEGRLLLAKRSHSKRLDPGKWETPGGFLEHGEEPLDGLRREMREELGCDVTSAKLAAAYMHEEYHLPNILLVYEITLGGELRLNPDEIAEVRWFSREEAVNLEFASTCRRRAEDYWDRREASRNL